MRRLVLRGTTLAVGLALAACSSAGNRAGQTGGAEPPVAGARAGPPAAAGADVPPPAGAVPGAPPGKLTPGPSGRPEITVLYFNDLHGHLVPFSREGDTTRVGGAARMATVIKRVRQENRAVGRATVLLEGGDIFQGTPLSSVFKGEPDFKFLNMIELDAMVLGNHEFDFGLDILRQRIFEAHFPVLAANVLFKEGGERLARPYALRTLPNGVRVAILGFVTDDTPETTDPMNVEALVFEPPVLAAARYVPAVEDSTDLIFALTHIGLEEDKLLARTYDEIDVIVGGHDQVLIRQPLQTEEVIIAQAQEHGLFLGRIDLAVDDDRDEVDLIGDTLYPITADIPDDPEVAAMVASYTRRLDRELSRTTGSLATPLEGERHLIRNQLTNFGLLLTTLMKEQTGADLAVLNSGAIRSSIAAGPVTLGEIIQALPFANRIMTVQLTGDAVLRMLEQSLREQREEDGGGFLQVSGLTYGAGGATPADVRVGGEPLDPARTYTVAITDFLYHGGDGYDLFLKQGKNPRQTGPFLAEALSAHIRANSPLSAPQPPAGAPTSSSSSPPAPGA